MTIVVKKPISEISPPLSEAFKLLLESPMKLDRNRSILATNFIWKQAKKKRVFTNAKNHKRKAIAYNQFLHQN